MKIKLYKTQKNILIMLFGFVSSCSIFAQVNTTKIKDGTVSTGPEPAKPGAIFELESNNKGMLTSRLTTAQRDDIPAANLSDGLLIFNTTTGCYNYWSEIQSVWLSICGTPPPAVFNISTLQCSQIVANGTYKQGDPLTLSNYLTIPVTVTQPGTYIVSATTTNGYYFNTNGTFPSAGTYTLNLPGTGTPNNGFIVGDPGDPVAISLNGTANSCIPNIYVEKASVDFTIACASITPQGSYFIDIPLTELNKLTLNVTVSAPGFWSMNTNSVNGYSFSGTGTFSAAGAQTIELLGTGKPIASGTNNFNLSSNATTPASCSGVPVVVSSIAYTVDCNTATQNGIYMQNVALTAANTIILPINVTATGQTTISTSTVNGISFTSGLINLAVLGPQNITLAGSGTPITAGVTALTLSGIPGITGTCPLNITIAAQPVTYTTTCTGITTAGNYAPGKEMTTTNTMTVPVNVTYVGAYSISTDVVNGVSFSGTGTFTVTGAQNVILTATGTPASGGTFSYGIRANSANGATACSKSVIFAFDSPNILGLGSSAAYYPGASSSAFTVKALLTSSANFGVTGTVPTQPILFTDGTSSSGTALKNLINNNNIDIIIIGYNYYPNAASISILTDFVVNKKGVLIQVQEADPTGSASLINAISGGSVSVNGTALTHINPIVSLSGDPVINGPFGNLSGKILGSDVGTTQYNVSNLPSSMTALSTSSTDAARAFVIKHNTLGYVFCGDGGLFGGNSSSTSTDNYPAKISATGLPMSKNWTSGTVVDNSTFYANMMAWAFSYVQINTVKTYTLP